MVVNVDGMKAKKGGKDEKRAAAAEAVDEESIADMSAPDDEVDAMSPAQLAADNPVEQAAEEARAASARAEQVRLSLREGFARLGGLKHMLDVERLTAKGSREITTAEAFNEHLREFCRALHRCLIGDSDDG